MLVGGGPGGGRSVPLDHVASLSPVPGGAPPPAPGVPAAPVHPHPDPAAFSELLDEALSPLIAATLDGVNTALLVGGASERVSRMLWRGTGDGGDEAGDHLQRDRSGGAARSVAFAPSHLYPAGLLGFAGEGLVRGLLSKGMRHHASHEEHAAHAHASSSSSHFSTSAASSTLSAVPDEAEGADTVLQISAVGILTGRPAAGGGGSGRHAVAAPRVVDLLAGASLMPGAGANPVEVVCDDDEGPYPKHATAYGPIMTPRAMAEALRHIMVEADHLAASASSTPNNGVPPPPPRPPPKKTHPPPTPPQGQTQ